MNFRSFVGNQVEKLSTPTTNLVDIFRQTVDHMKLPFSPRDTSTNELLYPSESISDSSRSSNSSYIHLHVPRSISTNTQPNLKILTDRFAQRSTPLRRHVSESNKTDQTTYSRPIYHNNPPIDVHILLNNNSQKITHIERSRSLIRQSTDTTCTYPIQYPIRRMESIEIPGLNGVKAIRYINNDLGKLEPHLYKKEILQNDSFCDSGKITFTLFYNQSLTSLKITILSIEHVPYRNLNLKILPNPFLKLTLLPDRRKRYQTKVYKHTQSTEIHETFQFHITFEELCERILLLSLYDFRRSSKRNLIGTVKIDEFSTMSEITLRDITFTKNIISGTESDPDLGELTVSLCYLPNAKRISVTIVKANSLKPMDINGKSDPYVKVLLLINGKKIRKKKTSVLSNTLNPVYNESLEFDLSNDDLANADLIFKVIDYDRVGSNELIGCCGIGIHFDGINRGHWYQMLEYPRVPVTQKYNLRETIPIITCTNSRNNL